LCSPDGSNRREPAIRHALFKGASGAFRHCQTVAQGAVSAAKSGGCPES
jgi:hypothetical protein